MFSVVCTALPSKELMGGVLAACTLSSLDIIQDGKYNDMP